MSSTKELDPESLGCVPIFPLRGAVLFPHTLMPLHIFEPRYREMMAYILKEGCPLVMGHVQPGDDLDAFGNPVIYAVAGAGKLFEHTLLPDGRYDILVQGIQRVRLLEELDSPHPFRLGRFETLTPSPEDPNSLDRRLAALQGIVLSVGRVRPRLAGVLSNIISEGPTPQAVTDILASLVLSESHIRQAALESDTLGDTLDQIFDALLGLLPSDLDPENMA